ncbi:hypothetical protein SHKM778_84750 [Streptomyces sp. KM77-8]|uniref:DUF7847 domain-containing protein n=1 Tax=Streptomyces haneummycinicus TaxID=3074435 RepID=A0AAT9HXH0_9ACTN
MGEILDGAVSTMRTYWRTVLGISLTVAVLTEVVVVLLQGLVLDNVGTDALDDPSATLGELTDALGNALLNSGVIFLITLVGTVAATALLTTVTSRAVLGRSVTTREAWHDARPQTLKLFGLICLLLLITAGIMTVGALPGFLVTLAAGGEAGIALTVLGLICAGVLTLWLMIRLSLASPTLMLEKQGIRKAMSRSARLVRGSWWRVFGIQLLATIIANIVASIIIIPFTFLAAAVGGDGISGFLDSAGGDVGWTFLIISGIGSVIGSMITFPITAGVTVLLYIDQRIRREALDLELARAADVQGPGATPGADAVTATGDRSHPYRRCPRPPTPPYACCCAATASRPSPSRATPRGTQPGANCPSACTTRTTPAGSSGPSTPSGSGSTSCSAPPRPRHPAAHSAWSSSSPP